MTWYEESIVKGRVKPIADFRIQNIKGKTMIPCPHCRKPMLVYILVVNRNQLHHCPFCEKDFDVIFEEK